MTSGTLMSNCITELSGIQADQVEQESTNFAQDSARLAKLNKLPYQASHKAELFHLEEDIDALIRQLQSLKQQRLCSEHAIEDLSDSKVHALV